MMPAWYLEWWLDEPEHYQQEVGLFPTMEDAFEAMEGEFVDSEEGPPYEGRRTYFVYTTKHAYQFSEQPEEEQ